MSLSLRPEPAISQKQRRFAAAVSAVAVHVALMLGMGAAFGLLPAPAAWAQKAPAGRSGKPLSSLKVNVPTGMVPHQPRRSVLGPMTFLPKGVTQRSTVGVKGFGSNAPASGRALIGGSNGANVQEQVVNLTQTPAIDERTPFWTADERFLYFAGGPQNGGANPRYGLYRTNSTPPAGVTGNAQVAITNPTDNVNDYYFPALNQNATRIAFLRSSDGKNIDDTTKRFELYVSDVPGSGQFIDLNPTGPTNLRVLTVGKDFPDGNGGRTPFVNIGRPTWIGSNDLAFAGQLGNDPNYHIFTINVQTRIIFQLTGGNGASNSDERNPAASPDGRYIAFDSNAQVNTTGGTYNNVITLSNGGPLVTTRVRSESDPSAPLTSAPKGVPAVRNLFVMGNLGQNATQITGQYANALATINSVQPTWSSQQVNSFTNTNGQTLYLGFSSNRVPTATSFKVGPPNTSSIYYVVFSRTNGTGSQIPARLGDGFFGEADPTDLDNNNADGARLLDTANNTITPTGAVDLTNPQFADVFPTFSPTITVFRAGFQSNREGTLFRNGFGSGFSRTPLTQNNLFIASLLDIDAPTLLRYDTSSPTGEVVHISLVTNNLVPFDINSRSVRSRDDGITPNIPLHFAVRVEDRESGMRPENSPDGGAVYLMFKNPNSKYQSTAQGGAGVEHKEFGLLDSFILVENNVEIPYTSPGTGANFGYEYEADAISAAVQSPNYNRTQYFHHLGNNNDFNDDIYVPGLSDLTAFTGIQNPPLDGLPHPDPFFGGTTTTPAIWLKLSPLVQKNPDGTNVLDGVGNTIPIRPADGLGGVLYGATWTIPAEASDWYMDVILYDNAVNPFDATARSNFIMYDNVWGFSSALPLSGQPTDILVVADYTLGQKFFNSRFGQSSSQSQVLPGNLTPLYFGAESYYTDIDMLRYPSEAGGSAPPSGTTGRLYDRDGVPFRVDGTAAGLVAPGGAAGGFARSSIPNVLGVESYNDEFLDGGATDTPDGYRLPPTGRYSIWRILSRGPVPASLLQDYLPQRTVAPADIRKGESTPRTVTNATRMVVWASPFSGDLFVGAGTITDIQTQNDLTNFVTSGGRLFISGQDIAFALAGNGQQNAFFSNILKAKFVNDQGGLLASSLVIGANQPTVGGYTGQIHRDAWDSSTASHAYGLDTLSPIRNVYSPPDASLRINNFGNPPAVAVGDASLTSDSTSFGGYLDSITTNATAQTTPITVAPDSVDQFDYNTGGGGALIVSSYPAGTSAVGLPPDYNAAQAAIPQGKVAYSAMGFESVSLGFYSPTGLVANLGRRAEIMHNITCAFRSGTITGRIIDNNGSPVPSTLVRAVINNVGNEPNVAAGTAITDENGNFQIVGLQAGFYYLFGYKAGYYTQHTTGNTVHGGWRSATNLALKAASPGALSGVSNATTRSSGGVFTSDGVTPIRTPIEIQVRRQEADGSFTEIATLSSDGVSSSLPAGAYSLPNLLIGDYQVFANARTKVVNGQIVSKDKGPDGHYLPSENVNEAFGEVRVLSATQGTVRLGPGTTVNPNLNNPTLGPTVPILEGITAQIDFLLPSAPQAVHGQVVEQGTNTPIAGATVTATLINTTTGVASAVTDANGNYTLSLINQVTGQDPTLLAGGIYVIHADANGYNPNSPPSVNDVQVSVGGGSTLPFATAPTIQLAVLPPGSVSGLVQLNNGTVLTTSGAAGATVSFYVVSTVNGVDQQSTTAAFTATVSATPTTTADIPPYRYNYSVASVKPGRYNAYVSKPGLSGSPNPFANVVITTGTETRNINFTLEPPRIYGAGVQLVSVPFDYSALDPRTIFGLTAGGDNNGNGVVGEAADQTIYNAFDVADWTGTDYNIAPNIPLRLGKGYFVRFGAISVVTAPSGGSAKGAFTVNLANGWNLIGHPFDNRANPGSPAPDINLTDPTVTTFSYTTTGAGARTNVSLAQAVADGVVGSVAYSYTGSNGGSTYVQTGLVRPFFGYWFHANAAVQMTFQYPDPAYRSVNGMRTGALPSVIKATRATGGKFITQTRAELDKPVYRSITSKGLDNWRLQIAAQQGDLKDSDNSIGVSPDAKTGFDNQYDNEKPPMMGTADADSLYVGIKGVNADGKATDFSDMVQNTYTGSGSKSWEFSVQTTNPGKGEVTLTWPNAARLPRGVEPVLVDTVSGKRFNMRTGGSSFRFTPSAGRAQHLFRVEVAPPATTPLDLVNVRVSRTQGSGNGRAAGGFRFAFTATRDADITAEVQTMTGKVVRTLSTRAVRGTEASVQWDGRSAIGADVPAGVYMLRLTARDSRAASGGAQVTRQVPIMSIR